MVSIQAARLKKMEKCIFSIQEIVKAWKKKSYQKIAYSEDGRTFIKKDQVIETPIGYTEHHRDPKVWEKNGVWWMIVGAQTQANGGAITLFESSDLVNWQFNGEFYSDEKLDQM